MNAASVNPPRRAGPFILEDEQDGEDDDAPTVSMEDVALPPKGPSPLSEISPNASQRSMTRQKHIQDGKAQPHSLEPPDRTGPADEHGLKSTNHDRNESNENIYAGVSDLAALVASRGIARTASAELPKRKHRPLGRNASWISNPSASTRSERNSPVRELQRSPPPDANSNADGFSGSRNLHEEPLGTQLGYDMEDMDESHRRQMSEKFGCTLLAQAPAGKRVASVGTVKDNDSAASNGTRVVRKSRQRR
jgi:hypothetical protein